MCLRSQQALQLGLVGLALARAGGMVMTMVMIFMNNRNGGKERRTPMKNVASADISRSYQALFNEYLVAKIGVDRASRTSLKKSDVSVQLTEPRTGPAGRMRRPRGARARAAPRPGPRNKLFILISFIYANKSKPLRKKTFKHVIFWNTFFLRNVGKTNCSFLIASGTKL